jgi:hypothetical protein
MSVQLSRLGLDRPAIVRLLRTFNVEAPAWRAESARVQVRSEVSR